MKYLLVLALLVSTALADEEISNESSASAEFSENVEIASEVEAANLYQMNMMNRMRYSMMGNAMAPPQQAIEHYSLMKDEDFPVDYSLACSNSCNCRTFCVMYWWVPCTCACPPSCNNNQNNQNNNNNRFPPIEWQPDTQPPRPIFPRFTTTPAPIWNGRPEWIHPMPPRWPEWRDPNNPNNHLTFPPVTQPPATIPPWRNPQPIQPPIWINPGPQPIQPPIWINPGPWNPNNPNDHLTFPPPMQTTSRPGWWNPNQPVVPLPPNPNPPNWWDQQPNNPNPPNWWDQQPNNPSPPNWWDQQPNDNNNNNNNWWNQPNNNNNNNNWNPQPIEEPCDNTCSCTPCTVIWVCPPACSASCCASRGFGNAETVDNEESQNVVEVPQSAGPQKRVLEKTNQDIPNYLKDIFTPGMI